MKSKFGQKFVQTSDFTVKALMNSNSLNRHNFQTKTDMKVKICRHTKVCTQNKILECTQNRPKVDCYDNSGVDILLNF